MNTITQENIDNYSILHDLLEQRCDLIVDKLARYSCNSQRFEVDGKNINIHWKDSYAGERGCISIPVDRFANDYETWIAEEIEKKKQEKLKVKAREEELKAARELAELKRLQEKYKS